MKKTAYLVSAFVIAMIIAMACDVVEEPYLEEIPDLTPIDTTDTIQKILIIDFTGHKCQNCPRGHRTIETLSEQFQGRVVPISVHCGYYSVPASSGTEFTYDFRTTEGNVMGGDGVIDYMGFYGIVGYPSGLVQTLAKDSIGGNNEWGSYAAMVDITALPGVLIKMETDYDSIQEKISADIECHFLENFSDEIYLALYVTEDSVINWQIDIDATPQEVEHYVHRHVFRGSMNGTWGESLANSPQTGQIVEKSLTLSKGADWSPEHLTVVAIVYNYTTKEVVNVEEMHTAGAH